MGVDHPAEVAEPVRQRAGPRGNVGVGDDASAAPGGAGDDAEAPGRKQP